MRVRWTGSRPIGKSMLPDVFSKFAFDESEISFLHGSGAERFGKLRVSEVVLGDDDDAGSFLVETMDDAGAERVFGHRRPLRERDWPRPSSALTRVPREFPLRRGRSCRRVC